MKFKIVNRTRYELLEKIKDRTDNYIEQIKLMHQKIDNIERQFEELEEKLLICEHARREGIGRAGGLKASLNRTKNKLKKLEHENNITEQKLKVKEEEVKILRSKKHDVESYKNYFQSRKELERRERAKNE